MTTSGSTPCPFRAWWTTPLPCTIRFDVQSRLLSLGQRPGLFIKDDHTVLVAQVVNAGLRNPDAKPLETWDTGWFYGG